MKRKDNAYQPIHVTYECIPCAIGSLLTLFKKGLVQPDKQEPAIRALLNYLSTMTFHQLPPKLGQEMHRVIRQVLDNPDPYYNIKKSFNTLMLTHYDTLKQQIVHAADPFQMALRLSLAGNIIDFGPNHSFDIDKTLKRAESIFLAIDDSEQLQSDLNNASMLLFLADNAGEIVLDRLFLETIHHPNVYIAVRGAPVINDVTLDDASQIGFDGLATIISNGSDAPGTILEDVSSQFRDIFNKADLVISKGQGNYEGLCGSSKPIYFLLMAKCDHVANHLGVCKGDFVVKKNG